MERKKLYISIKLKFILTIIITILWSLICSFIEVSWYYSMCEQIPSWLAVCIIIGLAFLPGIMISITICGIILDNPRRYEVKESLLEPITILIAAYNEEAGIYDTLKSIALQKESYWAPIHVIVIDNNSKDNTKQEIIRAAKDFPAISIQYKFEDKQGKFAALNCGLSFVTTNYVITIDADCWLYKDALKNIVYTMIIENKNKNVASIAGTVLVRNSRVNILTKMQEWEYFLSLSGIKRMQGLFQSTLVAQGAFSIYDTKKVKAINGWPDSIGEDIVVTWKLLSDGNRSFYCDTAVAFTNAPTKLKVFLTQRKRWARGMIEGFRHFDFSKCTNTYAKFLIFTDLFLFVIDIANTLFFIPGTILAVFFHNWLIVGPRTLLWFPITILMFYIMLLSENNRVFKYLGLKIRKHWFSLFCYMITYSYLLSPVCVVGYIEEFLGTKRKWK